MSINEKQAFGVAVIALSSLIFSLQAGAADTLEEMLKKIVTVDELPAGYRNAGGVRVFDGGRSGEVQFKGPRPMAYIAVELTKINPNPQFSAEMMFEFRSPELESGERIASNVGVGSRSIHYCNFSYRDRQRTKKLVHSQSILALVQNWILKVSISGYETWTTQDFSFEEAGRIIRNLGRTVAGRMNFPPDIKRMIVTQRHLSREECELKIEVDIHYPGSFGDPHAGEVLVGIRIGGRMIEYEPGQSGFIVNGDLVTISHVEQTKNVGTFPITVRLKDNRFKNPISPSLAYRDSIDGQVIIDRPATCVLGSVGQVQVCRRIPSTRRDGMRYLKNTPISAEQRNEELETMNSPWLYRGDQVVLFGNLGRQAIESSISLEWKNGIRGLARYDGSSAQYSVRGEFTIGRSRGTSGERTNRWERTWGETFDVLFNMAVNKVSSTARDQVTKNPVSWLLKKIPLAGPVLSGVVQNISSFEWFSGDTVLSDVRYLEINSEVLVQPDHGGRLHIYTLEGNPIIYSANEASPTPLESGEMAVLEPGRSPQPKPFDPARLDRWWEGLVLTPWSPADQDETASSDGCDIPSVQANITRIRFFESGYDIPPVGRRTYQNEFDASTTRYINWELGLQHPASERDIPFKIVGTWFKPDGTNFGDSMLETRLEAGGGSSTHATGWGWKDPGHWQPGTYRVEFYVAGERVAERSCVVTDQRKKSSSTCDIESIQATVTSLKFFESGNTPPPKGQRSYATSFPKPFTRYVNWELGLEHPAPGDKKTFRIDFKYIQPDGSIFAESFFDTSIRSDWQESWHSLGRGWAGPGRWTPGTYDVEIMVDGKIIATGKFDITSGPIETKIRN